MAPPNLCTTSDTGTKAPACSAQQKTACAPRITNALNFPDKKPNVAHAEAIDFTGRLIDLVVAIQVRGVEIHKVAELKAMGPQRYPTFPRSGTCRDRRRSSLGSGDSLAEAGAIS